MSNIEEDIKRCEQYCPKTERVKELEEEREIVGMPVRNKRDGKN